MTDTSENEKIEIDLLLEAIFRKHGYDFRNYSKAHVRRRIVHFFASSGLDNLSAMQHKVLTDPTFFGELLNTLSINVTEMFRDPSFFKAVRSEVAPLLLTYPFIRVWHAGCATGEEVYSMAILLAEENLLDRAQIYATDLSLKALEKAREGIIPVNEIKEYTGNYQKAGGKHSFADYYSAKYGLTKLNNSLKDKIVFADHNLVTDSAFGEMHLIVCRNVLIYFNRDLQNKIFKLMLDSLCPGGFLCLGSKETLQFSEYADAFETVSGKEKIYRKKYQ
ncbi:MAG: protein-glutamate O-methyltransferase CheR [Proteobacteria bacterium]|nr:protein-glutamate O-methyltransferase CheR [Pseudomonadota bacterium]MBU1737911.1 protein-glutamate O-methyltransferase CheR [Pseudomonadota bacterium]